MSAENKKVNETPNVETKVETPKVETPKVETPKEGTPKVEIPKVENAFISAAAEMIDADNVDENGEPIKRAQIKITINRPVDGLNSYGETCKSHTVFVFPDAFKKAIAERKAIELEKAHSNYRKHKATIEGRIEKAIESGDASEFVSIEAASKMIDEMFNRNIKSIEEKVARPITEIIIGARIDLTWRFVAEGDVISNKRDNEIIAKKDVYCYDVTRVALP